MKGIVAFLWEEYENIHWQRNSEEQLSQAVSLTMLSDFPLPWAQLGMWCQGEKFHRGRVHWVLAWLAVLEVRSWSWKEKKDYFLQLWDSKEKKSPKPPVWNVRKESLEEPPFQTSVPQRLSLILRFRFLKYLYCLLRHLLLYLQLQSCSCAAYLYICWKFWSLVYLFIEFSVSLVLLYHWYLGVL